MESGVDYVVTSVRELPSGRYEAAVTLQTGPGHRVKVIIDRAAIGSIPVLIQRAVENLRHVPTVPR